MKQTGGRGPVGRLLPREVLMSLGSENWRLEEELEMVGYGRNWEVGLTRLYLKVLDIQLNSQIKKGIVQLLYLKSLEASAKPVARSLSNAILTGLLHPLALCVSLLAYLQRVGFSLGVASSSSRLRAGRGVLLSPSLLHEAPDSL